MNLKPPYVITTYITAYWDCDKLLAIMDSKILVNVGI